MIVFVPLLSLSITSTILDSRTCLIEDYEEKIKPREQRVWQADIFLVEGGGDNGEQNSNSLRIRISRFL